MAITVITPAEAVDQRLVGNTLVCQSRGSGGWRSMTYIFVTANQMFKQDAMKSPQGTVESGGSSTGAVYEWNKRTSGTAGVVTFRTYATKSVDKLSYETRYRVPNALSDRVTMDVVERGTAQPHGSNWILSVHRLQSSPDGPVNVPSHQETYRCQVKEGRHLL